MRWLAEMREKLGDILLVFGVFLAISLAVIIERRPQYSPSESEEECQTFNGRYVSAKVCATQSQITNVGDRKVSVEVVMRSTVREDEERQIDKSIDEFVLYPYMSVLKSSLFISNNRLVRVYDTESFKLLETIDLAAKRISI